MLGSYDPRFDKPVINAERVKYWIGFGAKPTDTMHNLLVTQKIIEGKKINVLSRKSPIIKAKEDLPAQAREVKTEKLAETKEEDKQEAKTEEVAPTETPKEEVVAEEKADMPAQAGEVPKEEVGAA